jgi:ArsR family transcriptional regulator, virulence genes transcriptional regulator
MAVKRNTLQADAASEFLKAFANPTRLRLLCALSQGERCVSELAQAAGVPLVSASQQLAKLRRDRVVVARRNQQTVHYRLADANVVRFIEALAISFCPSQDTEHGGSCDPDPTPEKRF